MTESLGAGLPLAGLAVVDTTDAPSWSSARLLADLGADVIRVERAPGALDPLAATRHVNKRSVVCEDPQQLRALLARRRRLVRLRVVGPRCGGRARRASSTRGRVVLPVRDHRPLLVVRGDARRRLRAVGPALAVSPGRSSAAASARTAGVRGRGRHGRLRRAGRALEPRRRRARATTSTCRSTRRSSRPPTPCSPAPASGATRAGSLPPAIPRSRRATDWCDHWSSAIASGLRCATGSVTRRSCTPTTTSRPTPVDCCIPTCSHRSTHRCSPTRRPRPSARRRNAGTCPPPPCCRPGSCWRASPCVGAARSSTPWSTAGRARCLRATGRSTVGGSGSADRP